MQRAKAESWRDRPLHPIQAAAQIAGLSTSSMYRFADEGKLELVRLGGRTLVKVDSLAALIDGAEPWTPSNRPAKACAARASRARAARLEFA